MSEYAVNLRRELHMYPELQFDLPRTLALVRRELDAAHIPYTEKYGRSCIVATLNEEKSHFTIGIRADMDALPITQRNDVPYKSKIDGQMHACGHDAHTAILIDTAKRLFAMKDEISCRVKFLFQSAEEGGAGAKTMVDDGVMDDIDCVIALHVAYNVEVGKIAFIEGPGNAVSNGFRLDFYGKSAHPAIQQDGIDAIAMAFKAYSAIELAVAKEVKPTVPFVFNCGAIHGGVAKNSICDHVEMLCTMRSWDDATDVRMENRVRKIIAAVAEESGGRAELTPFARYPIVENNPRMVALAKKAAISVVGEENIEPYARTMGGEDFAFMAREKPGCMFRLGTRNPAKDCVYSTHQDRFDLDEDALELGARIFVKFVLDNMNGIEF